MKPSSMQRLFLLLMDAVLLDVGYWIAFGLRFSWAVPERNWQSFLAVLPFVSILAFVLAWVFHLQSDAWSRPRDPIPSVVAVVALLNVGTMALTFWLRGFAFPRTVFLIAPVVQAVLLAAWRLVWWQIQSSRAVAQRIVVVGLDGDATRLASELTGIPPDQITVYQTIGEAEKSAAAATPSSPAVTGVFGSGGVSGLARTPQPERELEAWTGLDELDRTIDSDLRQALSQADAVFVTASLSSDFRQAVTAWCLAHDRRLFLISSIYDLALQGANMLQVGDQPVLELSRLSLTPGQRVVKRIADLALAIVLGAFALLLAPFIAAAVRLTSPGPILFRQERVGRDGKIFRIYKFRTMVDRAEASTGPVLAVSNDPRITRVGRFLRLTRLDELPQILNVLRGEMSFVGPRPERPAFVEEFARTIPGYPLRLKVKPGITGLAQVRGSYHTNAMDKLLYDFYYVRNYSPLLDLRILLQTLQVILTPEAAEGENLPSGLAGRVRAGGPTPTVQRSEVGGRASQRSGIGGRAAQRSGVGDLAGERTGIGDLAGQRAGFGRIEVEVEGASRSPARRPQPRPVQAGETRGTA